MNSCWSALYFTCFSGFVIETIATTVGLMRLRDTKSAIMFWLIVGGLIPISGYFVSFLTMPAHCFPADRSVIVVCWAAGAYCGDAIARIVNDLRVEKQKQSQNAQKKQE